MRVRHDTAPTARAIKVLSALVILLGAGILIGSFWAIHLLPAAAIMTVAIVGCYLRAPVGYDVSYGRLTVLFRVGSKQFGRITGCDRVLRSVGFTLRLWGNGGLFAGVGIFWNRRWGIFRAYVTTSSRDNLLLIQTETHKVLISPGDPDQLIRDAGQRIPLPGTPAT